MLDEAHIIAIAVREPYRGQGIGAGLLLSAIDMAVKLQTRMVTLEVRASNAHAQQMYHKFGFTVVGERPRYYSDNQEDAILMSIEDLRSPEFHRRFLQLRATLVDTKGASPTLEALSAAYLQRNLPPVVKSITVHPAGEGFQKPISVSGEPEILGLVTDPLSERAASQRAPAGTPPAISFSRKLHQRGLRTFSWQAEDPNGDPTTGITRTATS